MGGLTRARPYGHASAPTAGLTRVWWREWSPAADLHASVEAVLARGEFGHLEAVVVGSAVVAWAKRDAVGVGLSSVGPPGGVVHVGAGLVAAFDGAAAVFDERLDSLGSVVEPFGAAEIEDFGVPPRTVGMIPASQAMRRANEAEMTPPVSSWAAFNPPRSESRVMVTTMVAFNPPALGSLLAG